MCVAAWAYITAAIAMGATALLFVARRDWEVPIGRRPPNPKP